MIILTRLNGDKYYLNPGLIEVIEAVPDTLVTTANGKKYPVRESAEEVAARIEDYRVRVLSRSRGALDLCADAAAIAQDSNALEE
jgi:flagellar protein FlbD